MLTLSLQFEIRSKFSWTAINEWLIGKKMMMIWFDEVGDAVSLASIADLVTRVVSIICLLPLLGYSLDDAAVAGGLPRSLQFLECTTQCLPPSSQLDDWCFGRRCCSIHSSSLGVRLETCLRRAILMLILY